jgi:hypothetical protein
VLPTLGRTSRPVGQKNLAAHEKNVNKKIIQILFEHLISKVFCKKAGWTGQKALTGPGNTAIYIHLHRQAAKTTEYIFS